MLEEQAVYGEDMGYGWLCSCLEAHGGNWYGLRRTEQEVLLKTSKDLTATCVAWKIRRRTSVSQYVFL